MKTFFIGWILLQLALCVIGDVSSLKSPRNVCLQKINTARAEYAKVHHIANMNKLAYYDIFERNMINAVSSNTACSEPRVTHNSSVDVFWNMNDDGELVAQLLSKPGRSLMACVKQHCPDTGKNVLSVIVDSSTKDTFDGEPGSECSRFRTPQQNGLCVLRRGYQRKIWGLDDLVEFGAKAIEKGVTVVVDGVVEIKDAVEETIDAAKELAKDVESEAKKRFNKAGEVITPIVIDGSFIVLEIAAKEVIPRLIVPATKIVITRGIPAALTYTGVGAPVAVALAGPGGEFAAEIIGVQIRNAYEEQISKVDFDKLRKDAQEKAKG